MNFIRKLETIIKPWVIVLIFLLIFIFGLYKEAHAETNVELGAGFLSGQYSKGAVLVMSERWGGRYGNKYSLSLGVTSRQEVVDRSRDFYNVSQNIFVAAQRRVSFDLKGCEWDCISLGIGPGYFNTKTRWNGSNFVVALSVEFRPTKHWSLNIRHFSNAGSAPPNMGQDMITIGYMF